MTFGWPRADTPLEETRMPSDGDYIERTTVTDGPGGRETVRETTPAVRTSYAGWWVAALVAVVAVFGLVFLFANQSSEDQVQAAHDQGVAEARMDSATTDAQRAATQASQAAQSAVDSTARASQHAAETAQVEANRTAQTVQSAGDAGRDASDNAPASAPPPQ
jgi:hypothetical protein